MADDLALDHEDDVLGDVGREVVASRASTTMMAIVTTTERRAEGTEFS